VKHRVSRFRSESAPAIDRVDHVSDLAAGVFGADPAEHDVADRPTLISELSTEDERIPFPAKRAARPLPGRAVMSAGPIGKKGTYRQTSGNDW
jgi:hypothetical protein